jgi:methylmalonyl-CoA/ethylmalonyl-CoA epimerase
MKFDHVGVVVANIEEGQRLFTAMFGIRRWTRIIDDPGVGVCVQFGIGPDGPCYELIAPLGDDSPIYVALKTGKGILNHMAYLVPDLEPAANELMEAGCLPVGKAQPAVAYDGHLIQFFRSPMKFIVELIEAPDHQHPYSI